MQKEFYDIEISIASGRLNFLPGKIKNSFRFFYITTLIALLGFGTLISTLAFKAIKDFQLDENAILTCSIIFFIGLLIIFFGLEYAYSVNKLRVIKGTIDVSKNFNALQLSIEKAGYVILAKSDRSITAKKHVRFERREFIFHGFVRRENVYFIIYKTGNGISIFTHWIKPLRIHEFEEFFEYAIGK